jgi:hypothetical protein
MRSFAFVSLLLAACTGEPPVIDVGAGVAATCGAQGQPCCVPAGGGTSSCAAGLACDGLAYASASTTVTTDGICGAVGGLHQACDPANSCFAPHVCMTTDGAAHECLDPIGGGLVCGNNGQACCAEPNYAVENGAGPAIWCHVGLRCNDQRQCAP